MIINVCREHVRKIASPHYYHGRSVFKLLLHNLLQIISFLRTPKPVKGSIDSTKLLRGSKKGKVALVLGSGPSLNSLNVEKVSEFIDDVFVINSFNQLEISEKIMPIFYGLSDPAHFGNLSGAQEQERKELLEYVKSVGATLVLPHNAFGTDLFNNLNKVYFDDRELTILNRNLSPVKPRAYGSTTIYKMLAMAVFLGYDEIFILGFDNTNFLNYRGRPDNLIHDLGGATATRKVNSKSSFIGEYEKEFTSGMAGRMQSYAHLFGDLHKFSSQNVTNLDPYSLTDAFRKAVNHPMVSITTL